MQRWMEHGWATSYEELRPEATWWNSCAPLLEDAWNYWAPRHEIRGPNGKIRHFMIADRIRATAIQLDDPFASRHTPTPRVTPFTAIAPDIIEAMIHFALDAGLRSLDQGLAAALDYLWHNNGSLFVQHCGRASGVPISMADIQRVELTAIAEGHTSSIIRTTVWCKGRETPVVFGLNIARDMTDAADELGINTRDLREWSALEPDDAATVYGAGEGQFLWFGQVLSLPVVAVKWFDSARELHVIRDEEDSTRACFFLVNEFRESKGPLPELMGIRLDEAVSDKIWAAIVAKRTVLASIDWQAEWIEAPNLELNHGDVVAEIKGDDIHIAFVASSAQRWQGPIGAWLYEMALASARDDRSSVWKRIYWRKPAAALRAVYEGIVKKIPNNRDVAHRLALRMFESAQAIEPEQIISYLSLAPNDAEGLSLVEQTRGEVVTFLAGEKLKA